MVYLFFATGTEEIEALATVDILRRAGLPRSEKRTRHPEAPEDIHSKD